MNRFMLLPAGGLDIPKIKAFSSSERDDFGTESCRCGTEKVRHMKHRERFKDAVKSCYIRKLVDCFNIRN